MKDKFPSILDHLNTPEREKVHFVCPTVGFGITEQCVWDSPSSPAAKNATIRTLELGSNQAIPFHWQDKEKIYEFLGGGHVDVFVLIGNIMRKYPLNSKGDILLIPSGCPHAVLHFEILPVELIVISYPMDTATYTEWEPTTEELLKNEHLCTAD